MTLKRPPLSKLCPGETNYLRFRLSPDVTIAIGARVKRPGEQMIGDPTEAVMFFDYVDWRNDALGFARQPIE